MNNYDLSQAIDNTTQNSFDISDALVSDNIPIFGNELEEPSPKTGSECPVVVMKRVIQGSYWYSADNFISGGACEGAPECDMDYGHMCFYMSMKSMEMARFELGKPDLAACMRKWSTLDWVGKPYQYLYKKLVKIADYGLLYKAFIKTYTMLAKLEQYLYTKTKSGTGMSIPKLELDPNTDMMILYSPQVLHETVGAFVAYMSKINIRSISKRKYEKIAHDSKPPAELDLTMIADVDLGKSLDVPAILQKIKDALSHERKVCEYLYEIEVYHVAEIKTMTAIQQQIKDIYDDLM